MLGSLYLQCSYDLFGVYVPSDESSDSTLIPISVSPPAPRLSVSPTLEGRQVTVGSVDTDRGYLVANMAGLRHLKTAVQFFEEEKYPSAINEATRGLATHPTNKSLICKLYLQLAKAHNKMRNYDLAIQAIDDSLGAYHQLGLRELSELSYRLGTEIAYAKYKKGEYAEVIELPITFMTIESEGFGRVEFCYYVMRAHYELKNYDYAEYFHFRVLDIIVKNRFYKELDDSKLFGSFFMLSAAIFAMKGRHDGVLQTTQMALALHQDFLKKEGGSYLREHEIANLKAYQKYAQNQLDKMRESSEGQLGQPGL